MNVIGCLFRPLKSTQRPFMATAKVWWQRAGEQGLRGEVLFEPLFAASLGLLVDSVHDHA